MRDVGGVSCMYSAWNIALNSLLHVMMMSHDVIFMSHDVILLPHDVMMMSSPGL